LADREAVLIVDETGFLKKGTKSAVSETLFAYCGR
jgi:SRSO17 transposase